ncbi:MAG: NAD(P)H-dependent oxidoreductase [Lachnospiraceae bacterium]|nr:NAD(P)H-dependent oxidoreductase [Lachnospiraceae bacterium]
MRTAIIYYSMSGNTEFAAEKIAKKLETDVIRIEPVKAYPDKGVKKFFWGGKSAVMGEEPELLPYDFQAEQYDTIIIGTPIWASSFAPPIKTFLSKNRNITDKKIAVFTCFSGGGADKAIEKMRKFIGVDAFLAELILVDPKDKENPENDVMIEEFCRKCEQG